MTNESPRFSAGDRIKVVHGPYTDFQCVVSHPVPSPGTVRVTLAFFDPLHAVRHALTSVL
jgi:transcription antitermination factor NusG